MKMCDRRRVFGRAAFCSQRQSKLCHHAGRNLLSGRKGLLGLRFGAMLPRVGHQQ